VLLIGRDGQPIADAGDVAELDVTSLSSLTAGNVAATGGISKILREKDFTSQFHEGEKTHVHITLVGGRAILVVLFDERSSLGLVRLRVKKAAEEMVRLFDLVTKKAASRQGTSVLSEITDSDIDNLFND
jgi:predicted regulator of Ras-like GTPase activity (Roadblock/LC7/MglB family)